MAELNSPLRAQSGIDLDTFAKVGLRTLVLAKKEIREGVYREWAAKFRVAAGLVHGRDDEMDKLADSIERGLFLVGASAIEDKLQVRGGTPGCVGWYGI